jgi:hypothetical protein
MKEISAISLDDPPQVFHNLIEVIIQGI